MIRRTARTAALYASIFALCTVGEAMLFACWLHSQGRFL